MAADLESVYRSQLAELEHGQHTLDDLDVAYRVQLSEALAASRTMAGAEALESCAPSGDWGMPGSDHEIQLRRDLIQTQAGQQCFEHSSFLYS